MSEFQKAPKQSIFQCFTISSRDVGMFLQNLGKIFVVYLKARIGLVVIVNQPLKRLATLI
jgi:hypothetical protein